MVFQYLDRSSALQAAIKGVVSEVYRNNWKISKFVN